MDLVDRYLASIRRNLPAAKAEDIAAELADELQSRREDREARLGRALSEEETSAMLREFGHPLVVAARYRPHQFLIGPAVYPFYLYAMKVVLATGMTLIFGLVALSLVLGDNQIVRAVLQVGGELWSFFFFAIVLVTLIFALLERHGFPADHVARWMPEQLPDVLDRPQSQWNSALEVGLGIAFILWWTGLVETPDFARGGGLIEAAPVWQSFWLPILILAIVQLIVNFVKWLRPRWSLFTSLSTIGISILTLAIIAGVQRAGTWVVASPSAPDAASAAQVAESVNLAIQIALVVIALLMVLQILGELWKLFRTRLRPGD